MISLAGRPNPLVFETQDSIFETGKHRPVLVEANPFYAVVRLKGTKASYRIDWGSIWSVAAKVEAERVRREKKGKR